jgi:hypothetical protein
LQQACVICRHLELEPQLTPNVLGLSTTVDSIVRAASSRLDDGSARRAHVLAPVCPAHVIDIYRGRIAGVRMAWKARSGVGGGAGPAR